MADANFIVFLYEIWICNSNAGYLRALKIFCSTDIPISFLILCIDVWHHGHLPQWVTVRYDEWIYEFFFLVLLYAAFISWMFEHAHGSFIAKLNFSFFLFLFFIFFISGTWHWNWQLIWSSVLGISSFMSTRYIKKCFHTLSMLRKFSHTRL